MRCITIPSTLCLTAAFLPVVRECMRTVVAYVLLHWIIPSSDVGFLSLRRVPTPLRKHGYYVIDLLSRTLGPVARFVADALIHLFVSLFGSDATGDPKLSEMSFRSSAA